MLKTDLAEKEEENYYLFWRNNTNNTNMYVFVWATSKRPQVRANDIYKMWTSSQSSRKNCSSGQVSGDIWKYKHEYFPAGDIEWVRPDLRPSGDN